MTRDRLLEIQELQTFFTSYEGVARAVDGVSYTIDRGEVLGVVGESGCGKSVTAASIMRIVPKPGHIVGGRILFGGQDLLQLSQKQMRTIRGRRIAMIFQEPMTSLNPVFTIGDQIAEMFVLHRSLSQKAALDAAVEMLDRVQIPAPARRVHEYPHQLSGGMRQRAMIAMALACDPELLIADEPTTALDVTVQAQILDLMRKLRDELGTAIQIITHDLGVIAEMADRIVVMYAGKVVEEAGAVELFASPLHPYTIGLLDSIPQLGARATGAHRRLREIRGVVPNLLALPRGCAFYQRCPQAMAVCADQPPPLAPVDHGRAVRCWLQVPGGTS